MINAPAQLITLPFFKGLTPINVPNLTYTGNSMRLTCGPPPGNIHLGQISGAVWKFKSLDIKDGGRINITTVGNVSVLTVSNVISADIGKLNLLTDTF